MQDLKKIPISGTCRQKRICPQLLGALNYGDAYSGSRSIFSVPSTLIDHDLKGKSQLNRILLSESKLNGYQPAVADF